MKLTRGIGVAHRQLFVNITPNNLEHLSLVHFVVVNAPDHHPRQAERRRSRIVDKLVQYRAGASLMMSVRAVVP